MTVRNDDNEEKSSEKEMDKSIIVLLVKVPHMCRILPNFLQINDLINNMPILFFSEAWAGLIQGRIPNYHFLIILSGQQANINQLRKSSY